MTDGKDGMTESNGGYDICPLVAGDLEDVIALDRQLSGSSRRDFFERRLTAALAEPGGFVYVAARRDGSLAGFALVRLVGEEFGREGKRATLDSFGVDPGHQHHGLAHRLLDEIDAILEHKGVVEMTSQVQWSDHGLLEFLARSGFRMAPRIVLSRDTRPLAEGDLPADAGQQQGATV